MGAQSGRGLAEVRQGTGVFTWCERNSTDRARPIIFAPPGCFCNAPAAGCGQPHEVAPPGFFRAAVELASVEGATLATVSREVRLGGSRRSGRVSWHAISTSKAFNVFPAERSARRMDRTAMRPICRRGARASSMPRLRASAPAASGPESTSNRPTCFQQLVQYPAAR